MGKKERLYVSKKEGNSYFFRCFGDGLGGISGYKYGTNDEDGCLIIENVTELNVGDFVEGEFRDNGNLNSDFCCRKITPTEKDFKDVKMDERFILEVAKNVGLFFKDVLDYGKQKIEEEQTENSLVYSDKKINNLVKRLVDSVSTYGVYNVHSGYGLWWFCCQLNENNSFGSFVNYRKILGLTNENVDIEELPTCVPKKYSDRIYSYVSTNIWDENNPSMFRLEYGEKSFCIKRYYDRVEVIPYYSGDFQEEMERIDKYQK